ncbi:hypothetical protein T484DRAFT_1836350 [Baffinella frigidus]|nr:hypothetical protein T484DRAFT_1836350 [Cryptophyta sp. CCMP2293]
MSRKGLRRPLTAGALQVLAARGAGVVLLSRTLEKVTVDVAGQHESYTIVTVDVAGQHESYTIVRELEFTSERKRMSVVLREDRTGELVLLCKGADESVRHILAPGQEVMDEVTSQHIEDFARSGLRTLLVCHRRVSRQEMDR